MSRLISFLGTGWTRPDISYALFIKWWMLLRAVLVATTMMVVFFFSPGIVTGFHLLPPVVTALTLLVSWLFYRSVRRGNQPEIQFYLQYFIDIFLISLLNLITMPADVSFVPLYLLSITVAAILSLRPGALFTATAASLFFLPVGLGMVSMGFTFSRALVLNIVYVEDTRLWLNVGLQVFLFYMIALITSQLSRRLRRTGWELEDTRRLFWQYRVDTDEILQNIDTGLVTVNQGGTVVYANPAACRMLGAGSRRAVGRSSAGLFSRVCPELEEIVWRTLTDRAPVAMRHVSFKDNEQGNLPVAVNSSLMLEQNGRVRGVSLILQDMSHEARARELEMRTGKLEAVAELSAALAHEIKNPLASIRSAVEMLRDPSGGSRGGPEERLMSCVLLESDRLTQLLKQFLQFASGSLGPVEKVRVGEVVSRALESLTPHPEWRPSVRVQVDPEAAEAVVLAHPDSLCQVFFNLMLNSVQAGNEETRRTGTILIVAARAPGNGPARGAGELFWLRISDDGPGIDPAIRGRIFEPFVTTRRQGFGLGTAVVYRIVTSLGGMVLVEDCPPDEGAAFLIGLPRPGNDIDDRFTG